MIDILNGSIINVNKKIEFLETIILWLIALLVPTFLARLIVIIFGTNSFIASNTQVIVGSIVNTALIISSFKLKGSKK